MALQQKDPSAAVITSVGGSATGGSISSTTPVIKGTADAGNIVTIYDGVRPIGSTTVAADGTWSFTPLTPLKPGSHNFAAIPVDGSGNHGASSNVVNANIGSSLPATPPAPTFTDDSGHAIPAGSTTADATPHINGTGTAGDTITVYDNGKSIGTTTVAADGTWSFKPTTPLPSGGNSITVTDTNASGTSSPSAPATLNVDTSMPATPPAPTFTDDSGHAIPAGSTTADATPHINGTGTAGDKITVYDNGAVIGTTTVAADGTWTFHPTTPLPSGGNSITVIEANAAGTPSLPSPPATLTVDTSTPATPAAPSLSDDSGTAIPAGSATGDAHPNISGKGTAGDVITVYDGSTKLGSTTVAADGTWTFKPATDLSTGAHSINVTETNAAGTPSAHSPDTAFTVSAAPAAPVITVLQDFDTMYAIPQGGSTNSSMIFIFGTGEAGDIVHVTDNGREIFSVKVAADGTWQYRTNVLAIGSHDFVATQTNTAGQSSPASGDYKVTVASASVPVPATPAAPTFADDSGGAIAAGSTTTNAHPNIKGNGTAGDVVTVYDGATVLGSTTVAANGTWTFKPSTDLSNGAHSINVTESNASGASAHSPNSALTVNVPSAPATPAAPTFADDNGTTIPAGSTTADAHPNIKGTGTAGDVVTVYDGATVLGSTTVAANGTWTFKPSTDLSNGAHSINVTESNASGASAHSPNSALTVDVPGVPVPATPAAPTFADDNGTAIPAGTTTADTHPNIKGTGTAGDVVTVYDGATVLGSTTVAANGTWTFKPSPDLSNGAHSINVTESNASGASAHSPNAALTVDATTPATPAAPTLTDDSGTSIPAGSTTSDGHPHVNGTGTAGDVIKVYDGSTLLGSTTIGADGKWTFTPSSDLSKGAHSINVTEINAAGTSSAHSPDTAFTYATGPTETVVITQLIDDSSGSSVTIPSGGQTYDSTPIVKGTVSAELASGEYLEVFRDGKAIGAATVSGTSWSFSDSGVAPGNHTYTAQVQSSLGSGAMSNSYAFTELSGGGRTMLSQINQNTFRIAIDMTGINFDPHLAGAEINILSGIESTFWAGLDSSYWSVLPGTQIYYHDVASDSNPPIYGLTGGQRSIIWYLNSATNTILDMRYMNTYTLNEWTAFNKTSAYTGLGATQSLLGSTDDTATTHGLLSASADSAPDATHTQPTTVGEHATVGEHDAFHGTSGHDTVDLNADPTSYFKESTAHIEGSTAHPVDASGAVSAVNTLHLTGDHHVLDLSALTGQTSAAKISGIEVFDLGGHANNLKVSLTDVLNLGETDLFQKDGHQQLMVKGSDGDTVDLSNAHIAGVADGQWQAEGTTVVGGVTYNVYEHSGAHTELLVQQGVQVALHN
jgi:hypothetical protein